MRRTSRATPRVFTAFALASALLLPAAAIAAQFDFYLKLPPIEGDSGKGARHGGEIEIQSFSWGATQTGSFGHAGGGGGNAKAAPTAVSHDLRTNVIARTSAPPAAGGGGGGGGGVAGKVAISDSATSTYSQVKRENGGAEDKLVAPRDAASGLATGKRMHKPRMVPAPLASGSVTVRGKFPSCTVGTRYPSLELGSRAERYKMHDVVITSCGGSDSGEQPMEEISFNYTKIDF